MLSGWQETDPTQAKGVYLGDIKLFHGLQRLKIMPCGPWKGPELHFVQWAIISDSPSCIYYTVYCCSSVSWTLVPMEFTIYWEKQKINNKNIKISKIVTYNKETEQ